MVKNFKGIVKVSDVQNEFNKLVQGLNTSVDEYNNIDEVKNIDYNKAGSLLGQLGYTLTIGGLKQFMQIYNGFCFGCKVFKTGNNQCKPTGGILVTEDKFYRIPTDIVSGHGSMLFYNPKTDKCLLGGTTKVTKQVSIPAATSNNKPWIITTNYSQSTAWKGVNYNQYGKNKSGWSLGNLKDAFPKNKIELKDGSIINKSECARYITLKYPSELTYKKSSSTYISICLCTPNLQPFNGAMVLGNIAIGFDSDNLTTHYFLNNTADFRENGVRCGQVDANTFRIDFQLAGKSDRKFKSVTIAIPELVIVNSSINATGAYPATPVIAQGIGIYGQNPTTTVTVLDNDTHDDVYKIADLNWEKTSSDKLWLNDLPHSMT